MASCSAHRQPSEKTALDDDEAFYECVTSRKNDTVVRLFVGPTENTWKTQRFTSNIGLRLCRLVSF